MFKPLLLAGLAAAALTPSLADAQSDCQSQTTNNRTVGTIIGAGIGALFGNLVSSHGGKIGGTMIGGAVGGGAGYLVAGSGSHCDTNHYGHYDSTGRWVAAVDNEKGYYDADGHWVDKAGPTAQAGGAPQPNATTPPEPLAASDDHRDVRAHGDGVDGQDLMSREAMLERDISRRMENGSIDTDAGHEWMRRLRDIRREDANGRDDDNRISPDLHADLERRLDEIADRLGDNRRASNDQAPTY